MTDQIQAKDCPSYCYYCGSPLRWSKKKFWSYDTSNGRRRFHQTLICPKVTLWGKLGGHFQPRDGYGYKYQLFSEGGF